MGTENLRDEILAKKPVIHTHFSEELVTAPHEVESAYNHHYHTHIPLGDTNNFAQKLIKRVVAENTTSGAIVAPWGYGKTSTLVFIWRACEEAGLVAVPPFIFSSLQDVLNATYGWLRFRLGSGRHKELQNIYEQYSHIAFEQRVKEYAIKTGVTEGDARVVLQQALEDGSFVAELNPINLMKFLESSTELVKRAGFKGLVILADELQNFFNKSADLQGSVQKLRDIVWWLPTHSNLPLGFILCMQDTTESQIVEPGNDVLDRLKENRLYINLRNIYSPEFPKQLWERYVELFEVKHQAHWPLDSHVLAAIGQIATREDLGRGPRTVIDIFQCAYRHYEKTKEKYTPVTLIDDFLTGQISFEAQTNPIRFAVEDALSLLKKQITTEAHKRAIKLWAAFPEHGCPDEILSTYKAKEAAYELSEMHGVHGPLLTYQSVGYTLRKLTTFTPGGTAVERIARDFWLAYKEQDPQWPEQAQLAFINQVLTRIFEKGRGAWENWKLNLTSTKSYSGRLTGTFSDQYPKRFLTLQISTEADRIAPHYADAHSDFQFDFVLWSGRDEEGGRDPGRIEYMDNTSRWIRFTLNLANRELAGTNLPSDLRNLKSSIHPNFLTPQLMLAFAEYANRWEKLKPDNHITESERGPLNAIIESMINYSIRVLFSDKLKGTFTQKLNFSGLQIIREVFVLTCQAVYPSGTYHPLLIMSERAFKDYRDALARLSLREKRGDILLNEQQKGKLATLFGIESHKLFENRAKNDYINLMHYNDRGGDRAEVQLNLHPLESFILKEIDSRQFDYQVGEQQMPAMKAKNLLDFVELGYRDEETDMVLSLLIGRELVGVDDKAGLIYRIPTGPSSKEVKQRLKELQTLIHKLPANMVSEREKAPLTQQIDALQNRFSTELEEEILEELFIEAGRIEKDLSALVTRKRLVLSEELVQQSREVKGQIAKLTRATELEENIPAGLDFRRHLVDLQEVLQRSRQRLTNELNVIDRQLKHLHDQIDMSSLDLSSLYQEQTQLSSRLVQLNKRTDELDQQRQGLIAWLKLLKESDLLYKSLSTMPDLRTRLTNHIVPGIMQNFSGRDVKALVEDEEHFRLRFDEIARERDARVAAGHEAFGEQKQQYRQWLAKMGVERSDFSARYSPIEHDQSYKDMYEQARTLALSHLTHLSEQLKELDLDLLKARRINFPKFGDIEHRKLTDFEKTRKNLQTDLQAIYSWLEHVELATTDDLDSRAIKIAEMGQQIVTTNSEVRRLILRPVNPQTLEEQKVFALLNVRREVDLTEIILSAGNDLDLETVLLGLKGLYQGNQISIKIQKRG